MACVAWSCSSCHGQRNSWDADLGHYLLEHYSAYVLICAVLDQPDVHDELYYAVRILC